jgi:hypothetical protein
VKVGVLGLVGSGKTTLLGGLMHHLARGGGKDSRLAYHGLSGAESFRDLFGYAESLEKGAWPQRAGGGRVHEYTLQLRERTSGEVLELKVPEMSPALVDEVWKSDRLPTETAFLKDYGGYLLLVDAGAGSVAWYVHLLQTIKREQGTARFERSKTPVAIVFTKWDSLPGNERERPPEEHARRVVPLLLDFIQGNYATWKVFGVSAVGATDPTGKPLLTDGRLKPLSLLAPFEWALGK